MDENDAPTEELDRIRDTLDTVYEALDIDRSSERFSFVTLQDGDIHLIDLMQRLDIFELSTDIEHWQDWLNKIVADERRRDVRYRKKLKGSRVL